MDTSVATMAPPPPMTLSRRRGWAEMGHVRAASDGHTTSTAPFSPSAVNKLSRSPYPLDEYSSCCLECEGKRLSCAGCLRPSMCGLSEEAQRFLDEDPFDFDALPHPVLMRQHAVCNARDIIYHAPVETPNPLDDDSDVDAAVVGDDRTLAGIKPRWNATLGSFSHAGRRKNGATLQSCRM